MMHTLFRFDSLISNQLFLNLQYELLLWASRIRVISYYYVFNYNLIHLICQEMLFFDAKEKDTKTTNDRYVAYFPLNRFFFPFSKAYDYSLQTIFFYFSIWLQFCSFVSSFTKISKTSLVAEDLYYEISF